MAALISLYSARLRKAAIIQPIQPGPVLGVGIGAAVICKLNNLGTDIGIRIRPNLER